MAVALRFVLLALLHKRPALMEHPAAPSERGAPPSGGLKSWLSSLPSRASGPTPSRRARSG
eukprot:7589966-Lingulodinium_polyedra.AAC.1